MRRPFVHRLAASACVVAACLIATGGAHPRDLARRQIYVSAVGPSEGDGTPSHPLRSIQAALQAAQPGDTIHLAAGDYDERIATVRSGRAGAPVTIAGARGARITGDGSGRQVQILDSYVVLRGLTIGNADKLVWIQHAHHVVLDHDTFENGGGECIRIKYLSTHNVVEHSLIDRCGLTGFDLAKNEHNGEGVYIGTDPYQLDRNPTRAPDASNDNAVIDNVIVTYAAECVDIKEAAEHNQVIGNDCSHSRDPKGSGFDARGSDNVFRGNVSADNAGAGFRFGGYEPRDGIGESATGNTAVGNRGYGFLVLRQPQGRICGNAVRQNALGVVSVPGLDPGRAC